MSWAAAEGASLLKDSRLSYREAPSRLPFRGCKAKHHGSVAFESSVCHEVQQQQKKPSVLNSFLEGDKGGGGWGVPNLHNLERAVQTYTLSKGLFALGLAQLPSFC